MICWCDNGLTDGKFTEGLVYTIISSGLPINNAMRIQGNQIGRQRQNAMEYWVDKTKNDWILWIDSDIHLTPDILYKLWSNADAKERPIVSGVYFISKENEQPMMKPYPAIFNWVEGDDYAISYVHPFPEEEKLMQVGCAGFGLLLMHKSVVEKMRKKHGNIPFFNETGVGDKFVSEDVNFFKLMRDAEVPLYVHTGAIGRHFKRFSFDEAYYQNYWKDK